MNEINNFIESWFGLWVESYPYIRGVIYLTILLIMVKTMYDIVHWIARMIEK